MKHEINIDINDFKVTKVFAFASGITRTKKELGAEIMASKTVFFTSEEGNIIYHPSLKDAVDYYNNIV